jgi:hypothetical protein
MGLKAIIANEGKQSQGLRVPFQLAGAPTSGASGSYVGRAVVGSQLVDTTNGKLYVATAASSSSVTWTVVGSQVP